MDGWIDRQIERERDLKKRETERGKKTEDNSGFFSQRINVDITLENTYICTYIWNHTNLLGIVGCCHNHLRIQEPHASQFGMVGQLLGDPNPASACDGAEITWSEKRRVLRLPHYCAEEFRHSEARAPNDCISKKSLANESANYAKQC